MKMFKKSLKRQAGFTLVELGIVVAIGAVIIGLGLVVVPSLLASTRANAEISEIPTIATKIQRAYANRPTFAGMNQATVIGLKAFPDSSVTGAVISNRWGGLVTVAPATLVVANDAFTITTTGVPSEECVQVGQGLETVARSIAIPAGTPVKTDGVALNLTTLGTQCDLGATTAIVYTFGK